MMDAGRSFDYGDPAAVFRADKPVQVAFRALVPLADRLDEVAGAAVSLWKEAKEWDGIEAFADSGYGVSRDDRYPGSKPYRFVPAGHPVQRLVRVAALEVEALAETA
jgi:hypothetical protein